MLSCIEEYISYLAIERGLSENTLEAYARDLSQFASFAARVNRGEDEPREEDAIGAGQSLCLPGGVEVGGRITRDVSFAHEKLVETA